jgi:four helix bundle protein
VTPSPRQSPIFARTYDLLQWLLPHTKGWPRHYRFTLTQELVRSALRFQERILEASLTSDTARRLEQADVELAKVRLYLRMGHDLHLMSTGQYAHVSELVAQVGRLLGAWRGKHSV